MRKKEVTYDYVCDFFAQHSSGGEISLRSSNVLITGPMSTPAKDEAIRVKGRKSPGAVSSALCLCEVKLSHERQGRGIYNR